MAEGADDRHHSKASPIDDALTPLQASFPPAPMRGKCWILQPGHESPPGPQRFMGSEGDPDRLTLDRIRGGCCRGNLCRCTGYISIIGRGAGRARARASKKPGAVKKAPHEDTTFFHLGSPWERARGTLGSWRGTRGNMFDDSQSGRVLYAVCLRSAVAQGRIRADRTPRRRRGDQRRAKRVITRRDMPGGTPMISIAAADDARSSSRFEQSR